MRIQVECADVAKFKADVLALKYAQAPYGVDEYVSELLRRGGVKRSDLRPGIRDHVVVESRSRLACSWVLFLGVERLRLFGYKEIRDFSRRVLEILEKSLLNPQHICMTIHGANYGLDEIEAFESEVAGLIEAVSAGKYPSDLKRISIIERDKKRADRLDTALRKLLPQYEIESHEGSAARQSVTSQRLRTVGYESSKSPHIFVAMPFDNNMEDVYHYGIQGAVREAGFLCERADMAIFSGDVLTWIKNRIGSAAFLVADLTGVNPNVYLEVGYAWGCGIPTILVTRDTDELKFDVRGQRCIKYTSIRNLEEQLRKELQSLGGDTDG